MVEKQRADCKLKRGRVDCHEIVIILSGGQEAKLCFSKKGVSFTCIKIWMYVTTISTDLGLFVSSLHKRFLLNVISGLCREVLENTSGLLHGV
jgi:hypothetical protein